MKLYKAESKLNDNIAKGNAERTTRMFETFSEEMKLGVSRVITLTVNQGGK